MHLNLLLLQFVDSVHFLRDTVLLGLYGALEILHLARLNFQLLLKLLVVGLLLLYDRVAFDNLLLRLLELLLHLADLALVDCICVRELIGLLLQRLDQSLRLLQQLFFVFDFSLGRLNQNHLLGDRLFLRILRLVKHLVALS